VSLGPVCVWDLPTRLFHWTLAILVVFSFITGKLGGNLMEWHLRSGYTILTLVLFRVLWGLAGARHALFANFVRGPVEIARYVRALASGTSAAYAGHNPLGALSVLAMLAALLVQTSTGLFANDDIATEGPLAKLVSDSMSDRLTSVHKINETVILGLVLLHLAAIAYYYFVKRDDLVLPMITGDKTIAAEPSEDDLALRARAAIFFALCAGLVSYVVRL